MHGGKTGREEKIDFRRQNGAPDSGFSVKSGNTENADMPIGA